jgi:hypothetical protein
MASNELRAEIRGWWRITETSQWVNNGLDDLGPALISITGHADRLRMHCLPPLQGERGERLIMGGSGNS